MKHGIGVGMMIGGWGMMILASIFMPYSEHRTEVKLICLTIIVLGLQLATL